MPEAIIETAIGLFFVFILMSMVSSQIVEWVASYRGWRAKELENSIRSMLNDPEVKGKLDKEGLVLADMLYAHPLIASLVRPGSKPSYIPASNFTLALFDVILTAGSESSSIGQARLGLEQVKNHLLAALPATAGPELIKLLVDIQALVESARVEGQSDESIAGISLPPRLNKELSGFLENYHISPQTFNALIQAITTDGDLHLEQLRTSVAKLTQVRPELAQLITSLFTGLDATLAVGDPKLAAARRNVEQWFDDTMDRAGGFYKRRTQLWLGLAGFILALMLNVDAMNITTTLWRDPTLRQSVVQQALKYQLNQTSDGTPISNPKEAATAINELNAKLGQDLQLPIGWRPATYVVSQNGANCNWFQQRLGGLWGISETECFAGLTDAVPNPNTTPLGKLLGFVIMAMAVSQGASYWFDLLSKLINLRGSGLIPATSRENNSA